MNVSIAVQHHPARADQLARFDGLPVEIVADPDPGGQLRNPWRTYHRALELCPSNVTHRVVLQDDVTVCEGFLGLLDGALTERPDALVALFVPWTLRRAGQDYMRACARRASWCQLARNEWVPVVALAWPVPLLHRFLEWADSNGFPPDKRRADDAIVGRFVRSVPGVECWATIPSLVEHPDDVPSLIGNRHGGPKPRSAICWDQNPGSIDWTLI